MTPAKGEQQESPNSLGETKEPQHSRLGEALCRGAVPSPAPSSLLGHKRAILCPGSQLSGRDLSVLPDSAALGGLSLFMSSVLGMPSERAAGSPRVTMGSCLGQSDRGGLSCHRASTQVMPASALALGYPLHGPQGAQGMGEPAHPSGQFSHQQHQLPEPSGCRAGADGCSSR